jgi:putative NADH-flavin reductase
MNVAVFGGTGGVGRHVVDQLLAQGDSVTMLVRDPAKVTRPAGDRLRVVVGGLDDATAIEETIAGSDAVISALGPSLKRGATGTPLTEGTRTIVAVMEREGVRRYIGIATPSIPDPRDQPTFRAKLLRRMASIGLPNALRELDGMTEAIGRSDLDWTVARFIRPTNGSATGHIRSGFLGQDKVGWSITRADIAAFLVSQLTDHRYLRAAPAISN